MIRTGIYRHFKGNFYRVLSVAQHSETDELHVVYQAAYGEKGTWIRPLSMFDELIERDGKTLRRFSYVDQHEYLEVKQLRIEAGQSSQFEDEFQAVQQLLGLQANHLGHELRRKLARGNEYLLQISWLGEHDADDSGSQQRFKSPSDHEKWLEFLRRYERGQSSSASSYFGAAIINSLSPSN